MPKTKGVGHSLVTLDKEEALGKLLSQHVNTVKTILEKYPKYPHVYHYIDAYAGSGYNEEEQCDGFSCTVALEGGDNKSHYHLATLFAVTILYATVP